MSGNLRLYNSGGYVELQAPSNATSQTLVLPTDSIQPALVHIATENFSSASSISFDNIFTNTYQNYKFVIRYYATSGTLFGRLRLSGSDDSLANYTRQRLYGENSVAGATRSTGNTEMQFGWYASGYGLMIAEISGPNEASTTPYLAQSITSEPSIMLYGGIHSLTNAYDGITIFPQSSTFTGSISVYGYRNS